VEYYWQTQINSLQQISDRHIVRILDGGTAILKTRADQVRELPFVVTELIAAPTLADKLADSNSPLPLTQAVDIATQIATALQVMHNGIKIRARSGQIINQSRFYYGRLRPNNCFFATQSRWGDRAIGRLWHCRVNHHASSQRLANAEQHRTKPEPDCLFIARAGTRQP
jgi:hypothetical protein